MNFLFVSIELLSICPNQIQIVKEGAFTPVAAPYHILCDFVQPHWFEDFLAITRNPARIRPEMFRYIIAITMQSCSSISKHLWVNIVVVCFGIGGTCWRGKPSPRHVATGSSTEDAGSVSLPSTRSNADSGAHPLRHRTPRPCASPP
eukprot:gnl/TRDRNA2_/TRDRNA2_168225_c0_seq1.p2 gnl/TRDRNA2_/TRDRNA2_168225_c0~~gnl/TRDRNA2_/TRDRNA2_168225_c0_seq1.p2  ORF type:complete len:147 (-),score=7.49 gnl/TRDRNA2_/TRDRNA2_168225_c0_seq1:183-623(-)